MRILLHIFRKDVRHLWPLLAVVLVMQATWMYLLGPRAGGVAATLLALLHVLLPLGMVYMVAAVIQEESLCDGRHFWLTRPYGWKTLLGAKAIFLLVFLYVPFVAMDAVCLANQGLPVAPHLPHLLWRQFAFTGWVVLGAVAVATVTRGLVQFTGTAVAMLLLGAALAETGAPWGPLGWIRGASQMAVFAATALAVVLLQYQGRRPALARAVLGGGFALTLAILPLMPWNSAFAVQSRVTGWRPEAGDLSVAFDPARGPARRLARRADFRKTYITIPVRLAGVPPGMDATIDAARVAIVAPGIPAWDSGWRSDMSRVEGTGLWTEIKVDQALFERLKARPVNVRGSVAVTLFEPGERVTASAGGGRITMPKGGACFVDAATGFLSCHFQRGGYRALVNLEDPATAPMQMIRLDSYGPSPADIDLIPFAYAFKEIRNVGGAKVVFTIERPAAHIILEFSARGLKLADYKGKES